jgi:DNA-binding LacI/PurR family transcriptional regulator
MKRITLREIANSAGVSVMTVSLALRDQGRLSSAMRRKVKRLAAKLKYRPDPALSALMTYRHERQTVRDYRTLAFVTNFPTADGWKREVFTNMYFKGACDRALELGYKVDPFWMSQPGMTPQRTAQILESRGIKGLLIAPVPAKIGSVTLDWNRFCAVSLCRNLASPHINVVDHNHYQSMTMTYHELRKRGYSRIGYAITDYSEEIAGRLWLATCFMEQNRRGRNEAAVEPFVSRRWELKDFAAWLKRTRPDVVVSPHIKVHSWLADLGLEMPRDIGFVWLEVEPERGIAGVWQHFENVGIAAVDLLHLELMRSAYGVPSVRQTIGIDGTWYEGKTLRSAEGIWMNKADGPVVEQTITTPFPQRHLLGG